MSERTIGTVNKTNIPELLAPVGGQAQLEAAVNNGADAVYMGGALFNARMKADNFDENKMNEAVAFAHEHGVKVYITLNTLIKDQEMQKAFEYACSLYEMGADAVILQDMGLARLIHRYIPDFPMHLSTQGTVYNISGLEMAADLGFSRIVPARELSLDEIRRLCDCKNRRQSMVEVEVFVHGALCMCYSGQCQMSRILGGGSARSGNRGLCAQPCRLQYTDDREAASYALSPKDICTVDEIPALCLAGVDSFKIEGRLKSPEYVATATRIYRKYIDIYAAGATADRDDKKCSTYAVDLSDKKDLLQIFNRGGFTKGYLYGNPGKKILSGSSPKNMGIHVGEVIAIHTPKGKGNRDGRRLIDVKLAYDKLTGSKETISTGDGIELSETGNVVTYVEHIGKDTVRIGDFKLESGKKIQEGEKVFKVTDKVLIRDALDKIHSRKSHISIKFYAATDEYPVLTAFADGKKFRITGKNAIEKALKRPADPERIVEQLGKLGGTPFAAQSIDVDVDRNAMVPVSVINEMRRQAVDAILESRRNHGRSRIGRHIIAKATEEINEPSVHRHIKNCDFTLVPLEIFMREECSKGHIPYLINVTKGNTDRFIEANFDEIAEAVRETGIVLGNFGWIREFQNAGIKVYGDYGLNVFNMQAYKAFSENDVEILCWSDETSENNRHCTVKEGRVCDGPKRLPESMMNIPLMITEHPLETGYLTDRKGVRHKVIKWHSDDKYLIF